MCGCSHLAWYKEFYTFDEMFEWFLNVKQTGMPYNNNVAHIFDSNRTNYDWLSTIQHITTSRTHVLCAEKLMDYNIWVGCIGWDKQCLADRFSSHFHKQVTLINSNVCPIETLDLLKAWNRPNTKTVDKNQYQIRFDFLEAKVIFETTICGLIPIRSDDRNAVVAEYS